MARVIRGGNRPIRLADSPGPRPIAGDFQPLLCCAASGRRPVSDPQVRQFRASFTRASPRRANLVASVVPLCRWNHSCLSFGCRKRRCQTRAEQKSPPRSRDSLLRLVQIACGVRCFVPMRAGSCSESPVSDWESPSSPTVKSGPGQIDRSVQIDRPGQIDRSGQIDRPGSRRLIPRRPRGERKRPVPRPLRLPMRARKTCHSSMGSCRWKRSSSIGVPAI